LGPSCADYSYTGGSKPVHSWLNTDEVYQSASRTAKGNARASTLLQAQQIRVYTHAWTRTHTMTYVNTLPLYSDWVGLDPASPEHGRRSRGTYDFFWQSRLTLQNFVITNCKFRMWKNRTPGCHH